MGPDTELLNKMGALNQYKIHQDYQVWRLVTSLFLTCGFLTYGINTVLTFILGFMVENRKVSVGRMALLYFSVGVLVNIFTVTCEYKLSCGNIGVLSGLCFALLALTIINWTPLGGMMNGMFRIILIFVSIIFFLFVLMLSFQSDADINFKQASTISVAGGIFSGLFVGMLLMPYALNRPSPYVSLIRKLGLGFIVVELIVLIPVFIWAINVTPTQFAI